MLAVLAHPALLLGEFLDGALAREDGLQPFALAAKIVIGVEAVGGVGGGVEPPVVTALRVEIGAGAQTGVIGVIDRFGNVDGVPPVGVPHLRCLVAADHLDVLDQGLVLTLPVRPLLAVEALPRRHSARCLRLVGEGLLSVVP